MKELKQCGLRYHFKSNIFWSHPRGPKCRAHKLTIVVVFLSLEVGVLKGCGFHLTILVATNFSRSFLDF